MAYQAFRKIALPGAVDPLSLPKSYPAPTGGWVSAKNPAGGTKLKLAGPPAERLESFFPTQTGIEIMGGSRKHATVSLTGEDVESIWSYIGGTTRELFAACDGEIFDITAPADPDVPPAADVTGQTSNYYSTQNYATAGGNFLYALNGTDSPRLYNGTTWTAITGVSVPAITGVTTSTLSHVNVYKNRLFMVQGGTMNVWALPVGSLGGAAIQISLSGIFQKGGAVLFTASWSLDSGSGLDDNLVIVSTEGEIAVYVGTDPSSSSTWSLVGVYDGPAPLGKNAYSKSGGTLRILTEKGYFPITAMVNKTKEELGDYAISKNIEPDWLFDARTRRAKPWEIVSWPSRQRDIISNPMTGDINTTPPWVYAVNTTTQAWCKRPGWDALCLTLHSEFVYFGTSDGTIMQTEVTGADDGDIYYPTCVMAWDHFGAVGYEKTMISAKAIFITSGTLEPRISASANYAVALPSPPNVSSGVASPGVWDVGLWDQAQWDDAGVTLPFDTGWVTVGISGEVLAPQIQLSMGTEGTPNGELQIMHVLYEVGEVML